MNKINIDFSRGEIWCDYLKRHVQREKTNKIHLHPYSELLIIDQGEIVYTTSEKARKISGRCVVYNRYGNVHNPNVLDEHLYERYRIAFYEDDLVKWEGDPLLANLLTCSYIKEITDEDFMLLRELAMSIYSLRGSDDMTELNKLRIRKATALAVATAYTATERSGQVRDSYIPDVISYIAENYSEKLTLETIAAHFYISRGKLIYDFKSYCNMSVYEYIMLVRMEKAKKMLEAGYKVSHISDCCGFSSASYFIKVFTATHGVTPLKYQIALSSKVKR